MSSNTLYNTAGIIELSPGKLWLKRVGTFIGKTILVVGSVLAIYSIFTEDFLPIYVILFLVVYFFQMLGIALGFHRYFSHKSFKPSGFIKVLLIILGSPSMGYVLDWAADHRRHHRFSDQPGDVHSPYKYQGKGLFVILRNIWHSHVGWLYDEEVSNYGKYIPDLLRDKTTVLCSKLTPIWILLSYIGPAIIAYLITWEVAGAWQGFFWGGCLSTICAMHNTMSVNSLAHLVGRQDYESGDHSRNNRFLILTGVGEGWHNNHHAFPASASCGFDKNQFDIAMHVLLLLQFCGLVSNIKYPPSQEKRDAKRKKVVI